MLALFLIISSVDLRITDAVRSAFGDEVTVTQAAIDTRLLVGVDQVVITAMSAQRCGKVPAVLTFKKGNTETRRQVLLTLERERVLVKTSRDIQPGEMLSSSDIQVAHTKACDARDDLTLARLDDALGMIARVRLIRGAPLRASELSRPPAINAKDRIRLVISTGMLHASAPGEALQSGAIGQQIRVTNLISSRTQVARIIDAQTVEVIP